MEDIKRLLPPAPTSLTKPLSFVSLPVLRISHSSRHLPRLPPRQLTRMGTRHLAYAVVGLGILAAFGPCFMNRRLAS